MPKGLESTDRPTDGWSLDRYITLSARRGQRKNKLFLKAMLNLPLNNFRCR